MENRGVTFDFDMLVEEGIVSVNVADFSNTEREAYNTFPKTYEQNIFYYVLNEKAIRNICFQKHSTF
jgi:hypothetical protein